MQEESSVYEGVLDVSILVPVCFSNPLTEDSINFLQDVLLLRRKALLPVTAVVGAYHIATNYLRSLAAFSKEHTFRSLEDRIGSHIPED